MAKRVVRLKTTGDVNRFLAKLINELRRDEIDTGKAGRIGYLCNILIGAIRDSELEKRVAALEEKVEKESIGEGAGSERIVDAWVEKMRGIQNDFGNENREVGTNYSG